MRTLETIIEWLESLNDDDLLQVYNEYCGNTNNYDDEIFYNYENFFNENFSEPYDVVQKIAYGNYSYSHEFIKFDGYGNLETFDRLDEVIFFEEVAKHILENEHEYSTLDGIEDYDTEEEETDEEESEEEAQ